MKTNKIKFITQAALISAIYIALTLIANALGLSVEYLITGKNANGENFSAKTRLAAQIFESLPQNDQDSVMALLKEMKKHI